MEIVFGIKISKLIHYEVFDEWHNGDPSVVYKDGIYFMAFSSTSNPLDKKLNGYSRASFYAFCNKGFSSAWKLNFSA